MSGHTPGPWRVTDEICRFSGGEVIRPNNGDGVDSPVAFVCDFNRYDRDEERQANARLIAAAPELLAAAKAVIRAFGFAPPENMDLPTEWDDLSSAIAKAEGRES